MSYDSTLLQRADASLQARLGQRAALVASVGAVLVIVSAMLPWTYTDEYPEDLTVFFYPAGPQIYVLVMAGVALVLLAGTWVRPLRSLVRKVLPHGIGGTVRALGTGCAAVGLLVVLMIAAKLGGLANVDPGAYLAAMGGVVMAVGAHGLPRDDRIVNRKRLPDAVEIALISLAMLVLLLLVVLGLAIDEQESFAAYSVFVGFLAFAASRAGILAWISQMTARHYGVTVTAAFAVAIIFPFTQAGNNRYLNVFANVLIFAVVAMGLNIVIGLAGLLDLGYIAFLGVGAYTGALLSGSQFSTIDWTPPFAVTFLLGALLAGLTGVLIGVPSIRTRGDYLAIVTLGFGEIFRITMNNLGGTGSGPDITNGPNGIPDIPPLEFFGWNLGEDLNLFGVELGYFANYYFLELALLAFVILVFVRSNNSRVGRAWVAIREDETAAAAMGVNTFRLKISAFVLGAALAGMAGTIKAHLSTSVEPTQFQFIGSAFLVAAIVLGGMGTVVGVLLGATVLGLLPEKLRFLDEYRLLIFGLILILVMRFRPEGLVPSARRKSEFHEEEIEEELAREQVAGTRGGSP
jgi:branched-chain amino acid transport system permease protein